MKKQQQKKCVNPFAGARLTEAGAEILDTTPLAVPIAKFSDQSETQLVLQAVIKREFEKIRMAQGLEPIEEFEDEFDFDVEEEPIPLATSNRYSNYTKAELKEIAKRGKKQKQTEITDDEAPVVRKAAKTARAKHVEVDKRNSSKLAADSPTEGASEEED